MICACWTYQSPERGSLRLSFRREFWGMGNMQSKMPRPRLQSTDFESALSLVVSQASRGYRTYPGKLEIDCRLARLLPITDWPR